MTTSKPDYRKACFVEYHKTHRKQIFHALRNIDIARQNLVDTQNALVYLLRNVANPYTERRFYEFYCTGGVTAEDWNKSYSTQGKRYIEDTPMVLRNLRIVTGMKETPHAPPQRPPTPPEGKVAEGALNKAGLLSAKR